MGVVPQVRFSLRKITATIVTCSIPHIALSIPLTHVQHIGNDEIGLTNTEALTLFQAAVTTDKKFVYANSFTGGAIVVFERDTATGLYSVAGVTREDTVLRTGNHNPERLVLSPDNGHLYVLGLEPGFGELRADGNRTTDSAISVFDRDPETGLLTQLDNNAADTDLTYEGRGLAGAYPSEAFVTSQDGNYLYFASVNNHAITVLTRKANGIISEAQFVQPLTKNLPSHSYDYPQSITISPDQKNLYVGLQAGDNTSEGAIVHFARNTVTGLLTYVDQLDYTMNQTQDLATPRRLTVSPDGKFLYAVGFSQSPNENILIFSISASGTLTSSSRYLFEDATGNPPRLYWPSAFIISNNGKLAYLTDQVTNSLLLFGRDLATGSLNYYGAEIDGVDGVVELREPYNLAISADNMQAFVPAAYGLTIFDIYSALSVTNQQSVATVAAGSQVTYTLDVNNAQGATAHHTTLTFTAPTDAAIVSISPFASSTQCSQAGNIVTCTIGDLTVNATERVTVTTTVGASAATASQAEVTADEVDNDPSNNVATSALATTPGTPTTPTTPAPPVTPAPLANDDDGGGGGSFGMLGLLVMAGAALRRRVNR